MSVGRHSKFVYSVYSGQTLSAILNVSHGAPKQKTESCDLDANFEHFVSSRVPLAPHHIMTFVEMCATCGEDMMRAFCRRAIDESVEARRVAVKRASRRLDD